MALEASEWGSVGLDAAQSESESGVPSLTLKQWASLPALRYWGYVQMLMYAKHPGEHSLGYDTRRYGYGGNRPICHQSDKPRICIGMQRMQVADIN